MFDIEFQGLRIDATRTASRELIQEGKSMFDVLEILEYGYSSNPSRRKPNIIEKSLRCGNKEYKAVVVKTEALTPDYLREEIWRLIHFGKTTYKKTRWRKNEI